ncbi:hypothetical protein Prudu_005134 [Prunus dulcis]|uniref:Uncharacterized protein n=1 Tax=Prunus dulcis TaxID=3755 RepID=A0A4Y1QWY2_PRUDU|nr:hypothetical protein Prudu_005134 [Prunus dulcis]
MLLIQYLDVAENICCRNNIYLGTPIYNTVLHSLVEAKEVGVFVTIGFHSTDPATCHFVFSAYANSGFHSTAMEALQVLSMRMICEEDGSFPENAEFEDDFIFAEDLEAESRIVQLFKDSVENLAVALLNLRWCTVLGFPISWSPNQAHGPECWNVILQLLFLKLKSPSSITIIYVYFIFEM